MKAIYPWPEMQPGDVREVTSRAKLSAVRQAAYEYCKRRRTEDGSGPAFKVEWIGTDFDSWTTLPVDKYRIERTA